ncbi:hypothetical protein CHS0354_042723 [Potamilus streckersoni]|uniref:Uncharacterized protein n=1 Tax=Potamilus streckersoni TaxID=2493646 RepID=A0AAE0S9U2_9BIVA|nr:hypothetical protein CHS0354_042723 [Potamilus streckersoni]
MLTKRRKLITFNDVKLKSPEKESLTAYMSPAMILLVTLCDTTAILAAAAPSDRKIRPYLSNTDIILEVVSDDWIAMSTSIINIVIIVITIIVTIDKMTEPMERPTDSDRKPSENGKSKKIILVVTITFFYAFAFVLSFIIFIQYIYYKIQKTEFPDKNIPSIEPYCQVNKSKSDFEIETKVQSKATGWRWLVAIIYTADLTSPGKQRAHGVVMVALELGLVTTHSGFVFGYFIEFEESYHERNVSSAFKIQYLNETIELYIDP